MDETIDFIFLKPRQVAQYDVRSKPRIDSGNTSPNSKDSLKLLSKRTRTISRVQQPPYSFKLLPFTTLIIQPLHEFIRQFILAYDSPQDANKEVGIA